MDVFIENLVPKKKDARDKLIIAGIIGAAVAVSIILFIIMLMLAGGIAGNQQLAPMGSMVFSIGLLLVAGTWYGAYLLISTRSIEYEYIMTNSEVDIDKVMSKKGRKHLISFDIKDAVLMARIDDREHNSVYKKLPEGVKVYNYSAMSANSSTYFVDCMVDDKRAVVLFQPTSKMVDALWRFNPKAVKKDA